MNLCVCKREKKREKLFYAVVIHDIVHRLLRSKCLNDIFTDGNKQAHVIFIESNFTKNAPKRATDGIVLYKRERVQLPLSQDSGDCSLPLI